MVVVDTNVLVAGLISPKGYSFRLLEKMVDGDVDYLMSFKLLAEYQAVLMREENLRKIPLSLSELEAVLALIVQNGHHQDVYFRWRPNLKDEGDNFLVELAVAGEAESIVTFNKTDFVSAELKFDFKIETPKELIKRRRLL